MGKVRVRQETGCLFFDFQVNGNRIREQTTLKDTKANRRKMERLLERIEQEIVIGTFSYEKFFPSSPRARASASDSSLTASLPRKPGRPLSSPVAPELYVKNTPTFSEFAET